MFIFYIIDALPTNLTIQKKACLRWINSILITIPNQKPINDFNTELKSGNKLIAILQKLSGQTLKSIRGRKRFERIQNVNEILKFCKNNQINTRSINSDAIVNGEERKILQLVWNIAEHYQLLKIEDKIKEVPDASSSVKGKILSWFQQIAQEYENLDITNFGQCWTDGHAFSAIIHFYRPDLLDVQFVMSQKIQDRFELIFDLAKENFGIAKLLEANEADSQNIDGKAMILYILVFLSKLPSYKERKEELELKKKRESIRDPDSDSSDDGNQGDSDDDIVEDKINVQEYEQKLRHVLNWLSNAEKTLNGIEMGNELKTTITQFHSFEKFMIDITSRQANIGFLLQQGQELLSTELAPTLSDKFVSYISQMSKRWEDLRKQSQDVQLLLHKTLNTQQMEQIKQFTKKLQELRSSVQEDTNKNNDPTTNSKLLEEFERKGAQLQGEFKTFIDTLVLVEEESDDSGNDLEEHINSLENDLQGYFAFIQERKRESQSSPDLDNEAGLAQDIESIKQWLENSHQKLIQQDDQAILDDADSFKARAEGVLLFQTQIHKCRQRITTLKKDYQELKASDNLAAKRVKPGLDQLVRQFDSLKIKAARQKAMIDKSRNRIESFDTEYEAFNLWVTGLLPKIEEFYADIEPQEVLQDTDDKEKQLREYSNDVKANESRRSSLERLLAQLKENFGEGFLDHFQQRLDEMNDHWKKMVELLEHIKAKIVASLIIQDLIVKLGDVYCRYALLIIGFPGINFASRQSPISNLI
ncbi:Utrophin [Trichoplax sp. H2]|nr:Utrophin [Trichoplax sp. H2]|eukprot:RDD37963.1 Utrophin [Trichoplax sp. H2]